MASFYNHYYRYYRPYTTANFRNPSDVNHPHSEEDKISPEPSYSHTQKEKSSRSYSFGPVLFKNPLFTNVEEPIFEILGIQLFLDDIIILGLLFFLYQEGVQDEMLYITLILLLLS